MRVASRNLLFALCRLLFASCTFYAKDCNFSRNLVTPCSLQLPFNHFLSVRVIGVNIKLFIFASLGRAEETNRLVAERKSCKEGKKSKYKGEGKHFKVKWREPDLH